MPKAVLHYYIQPKAIEAIYKSMNMAVPSSGGPTPNMNRFSASGQEDDAEFVDEDVIDEDD